MKSLALFIAGALAFGGAALGIGCAFGGEEIVLPASAAFGLAFIPAAATLAWVSLSYRADPDMRLMASLAASGFRMMIALGGGWYLTSYYPETFDMTFWAWLILFYLVLVGFEVTILVRQTAR